MKPDKSKRKRSARAQENTLKVVVSEIDKEILRLLMRRTTLVNKMRRNGVLDAVDEKFIRKSWQTEVAKVSRDAELSGRFFTLMQQVAFLPKPESQPDEEEKRGAFNLAPPRKPLNVSLACPLSALQTCAWLYLSAASGQPVRISPCLQNDPMVDFISALVQIGGNISREGNANIGRGYQRAGYPDRVAHVGGSEFAFYMLVAHYLGKNARVKFTGAKSLKLADFSALRHFLPDLGARLVNLMPHADGLPARLETSGILPPLINIDAQIPPDFALALLLAAPFYEKPLALNMAGYEHMAFIHAHIAPIYDACGIKHSQKGQTIYVEPGELTLPAAPHLPMDAELGSFLLSLAYPLGGSIQLDGVWPEGPAAKFIWDKCEIFGWQKGQTAASCQGKTAIDKFGLENLPILPEWAMPLFTALAVCVVLKGGEAILPKEFAASADAQDFCRIAGLEMDEEGVLKKGEGSAGAAWNAPSPAWALALAVAACARPDARGWSLANPAIVMDIWPSFWTFYNALPAARISAPEPKPEEEKKRRRIITSVEVELPLPKDE